MCLANLRRGLAAIENILSADDFQLFLFIMDEFLEVSLLCHDNEKNKGYNCCERGDKDESNIHDCYISNFDSLVRKQLTKHKERMYICKKCFSHKYSPKDLAAHKNSVTPFLEIYSLPVPLRI